MCKVAFDKVLDLVFADFRFIRNDICAWNFVPRAVRCWDTNDGCIVDERVRDKVGFELGRGDLETFVFDEFLIGQYSFNVQT
jgi:hypothetical protein